MISPSSIFSFETLRGPWRVPRGALLALALLAMGELAARALLRGREASDPTLRALVDGQRARLEAEKPALWMLGNSTLGHGVDEDAFRRASGRSAIKLNHGSATVRGSAAMLAYYLERCGARPERVLVMLTKDDLNANGVRAQASRTYVDYGDTAPAPAQVPLRLWAARSRIRTRLAILSMNLFRAAWPDRAGAPFADGVVTMSGKRLTDAPIPPDDPWFHALARDFTPDYDALAELAKVCRRHGIDDVEVVLLPITPAALAWHDRAVPALPFARLRRDLARACAANRLAFLDLGDPPADLAHFRDYVHLGDLGRRALTARLASLEAHRPVVANAEARADGVTR